MLPLYSDPKKKRLHVEFTLHFLETIGPFYSSPSFLMRVITFFFTTLAQCLVNATETSCLMIYNSVRH